MWLRLSPQSVAGYSTSLFCFPRRAPLVFADDLVRERCDATREGEATMKLPRRYLLHLTAGAHALPTLSRLAWAQAYPSRPYTGSFRLRRAAPKTSSRTSSAQYLSDHLGQLC